MSPPTPKQDFAPPPEGYVPVVSRTPEALEDERRAREAAAFEARVADVMEQLGMSRTEALVVIRGA